jgi:hypothetical protein
MIGDFLEIKFPVLGINTNPVKTKPSGNFADCGRFHRHPQAECGFPVLKFLSQPVAGVYAFSHWLAFRLTEPAGALGHYPPGQSSDASLPQFPHLLFRNSLPIP